VSDLPRQEGVVSKASHDHEIRNIGDRKAGDAKILGTKDVREMTGCDQTHTNSATAGSYKPDQIG
jgi:hypothetical protein